MQRRTEESNECNYGKDKKGGIVGAMTSVIVRIVAPIVLVLLAACSTAGDLALKNNYELLPCKRSEAEYRMDFSIRLFGTGNTKAWEFFFKARPAEAGQHDTYRTMAQMSKAEGRGFSVATSVSVENLPAEEYESMKLSCTWTDDTSKGTMDCAINIRPLVDNRGWSPAGYFTVRWVRLKSGNQ
jgi:uncharacterized SAM-binding protein YcdF (DUF218 family)